MPAVAVCGVAVVPVLIGGKRCAQATVSRVCKLRCARHYGFVSVYKVTNYLTRLETRIAEFSVAASHWVHPKPMGAMKVKAAIPVV